MPEAPVDRPAMRGWVRAQFDAMEKAVGRVIGARMREADQRLAALEARLDAIERMGALRSRLAEIERPADGERPRVRRAAGSLRV